MQNSYIFVAVFEPAVEGGYCVSFPDLRGCRTEGDTLQDAIHMAKDALKLHLYEMEADNSCSIPEPSAPENIEIGNYEKGAFVVPVEINMVAYRDRMNNKAVKKTLTIPYWMNQEAEKRNINFSQILQDALKEKLSI